LGNRGINLTERTSVQLKNAGGMRLIKSPKISDEISNYWHWQEYAKAYGATTEELKIKARERSYNIFNQFINVCELIKKDDIVIFGWTNLSRFISVNMDENIFTQILVSENNFGGTGFSKRTIEEIMYNRSHPLWALEVNQWMRFINVYLNNIGAYNFYWTADETIFNQHTIQDDEQKYIVVRDDESTKTNLLGYLNLPMFFDGVLKARIVEETNGIVIDDHMGEFGHKNQANYFYNHIIKNI
jgi:hypothetical protein